MRKTGSEPFVPVLTVLAEVGGPFIWVRRTLGEPGVGPCLADAMGWSSSHPLSEGLFLKFVDWAAELDAACRSAGHTGDIGDLIDWPGFHRRGIQLSAWLKQEVGDAYRVVYRKPPEDPEHLTDECTEIGGL